jgi:predicted acyl esterase
MRGSGCSGGAFGLFDLPTIYDAYDSIEIVASQSWVLHHKVGMVGISFSGFSQIFAAGTRPPGLAAIAPMSIVNDFYNTGFPGGMLNTGFAVSWMLSRWSDAKPAPQGGQQYAQVLIADGDKTCLANQALRLQTPPVGNILGTDAQRTPADYNPRSEMLWAKKITVPTFLVGAVQDEQVGGQWPEIISSFANNPNLFVTMTNGYHGDSLGEAILSRWIEFLYIYVADEVPPNMPNWLLSALETTVSEQVSGVSAGPPVPLRFTNLKTAAQAKADFKKDDPRVRVLFDNGGEASNPGEMLPEWEADFNSWPPKRATAKTFYLGNSGQLNTSTSSSGSVSFQPNPALRPATTLSVPESSSSNQLPTDPWAALPGYDWAPVVGSEGVGFISPVLKSDMVVVGPASLNLWVKSTAVNTDLQVTVSEVRPNGQEMYVQSGYLRASYRQTDSQSTQFQPMHSFTNPKNLTPGKYSLVRIGILPMLYAFRAGSRIRITIEAPGGDLPVWQFSTFQTNSKVTDTIGLGGKYASSVVMPVIDSLTPPDPQPACPSLRGDPCRTYVPAGNGG